MTKVARRLASFDEAADGLATALERVLREIDSLPDPADRAANAEGPLMQKGGFWFDGYEALGKRFRATLANPEARSTVLKINSPGGVCAGCFEAVRQAALAAEQYR